MAFDPNAFLNATHEEKPDDRLAPVPEGDWEAVIAEIGEPQVGTRKDGETYIRVPVRWHITDPEVSSAIGREPYITQSLFLDVTADNQLDFSPGKNIALGALLSAVGLEEKWSFADMVGRSAKVRVKHRTDDEGNIFDNVTRVLPLD